MRCYNRCARPACTLMLAQGLLVADKRGDKAGCRTCILLMLLFLFDCSPDVAPVVFGMVFVLRALFLPDMLGVGELSYAIISISYEQFQSFSGSGLVNSFVLFVWSTVDT